MSSAVQVSVSHVPGVPAQVGGALAGLGQWLGGKSGKCVRRARARGGGWIWRLNSQGGRNRGGRGESGVVEGGVSELPQNTNRSNGLEIHHQLFN